MVLTITKYVQLRQENNYFHKSLHNLYCNERVRYGLGVKTKGIYTKWESEKEVNMNIEK